MIGTEIGNYRILEKLGEGGMGVVYKAVDVNLDRTVAIKALNTELSGNPELEQRFRAEAKAQGNLNHTNLATLYALLIENGRPWMVMEFVEGETFEHMVQRRGPIPSEEAIPLFRQALLGIGYAHRMGIVHRDIKPANMMLNPQGIVKVMDCGIAKVLSARGVARTGTQIGTALYMSPEQFLNRGVDVRSDIYSLGVTLYEMLTGKVPFSADSDYQIMTDHVNTPPPLLTSAFSLRSERCGARGSQGAGEESGRSLSERGGIRRGAGWIALRRPRSGACAGSADRRARGLEVCLHPRAANHCGGYARHPRAGRCLAGRTSGSQMAQPAAVRS
jgi:serine/threonine protein kinase